MKLETLAYCLLLALSIQTGDVRAAFKIENIDCELSKALPAEASNESRRVACNIPGDLQEDVIKAQIIGSQLRMHDLSAWMTSDLISQRGLLKSAPETFLGWLTFEHDKLITTRYYVTQNGIPYVFAEADLDLQILKAINPRKHEPMLLASKEEVALLKARGSALKLDLLKCTGAFNTIVFPFKDVTAQKDEIHVYLMSPWTDEVAPLGGHHLIKFSVDGSKLLSKYSQTRGCVNQDARSLNDENMTQLMVTHLTSRTPTAIHVFLNRQYQKPIYVITMDNEITWEVNANRISVSQRKDGKTANATSSTSPKK